METFLAFNYFDKIMPICNHDSQNCKYWGINSNNDFQNWLIENGFDCIGGGQCSLVFRYKNSPYVLKVNSIYPGHKINFDSNYTNEHFVGYEKISKNTHACIQKFADCSHEAQLLAQKMIINIYNKNHLKNYGIINGMAVIVDLE